MLGWILSMIIPAYWSYSHKFNLSYQHNRALDWLLYALIIQFLLGILTLIMVVPVWIGVMHQAGAVVLLALAVYNRYLVD
jgi:cytochrome c oxidase assembly protein subunit 15